MSHQASKVSLRDKDNQLWIGVVVSASDRGASFQNAEHSTSFSVKHLFKMYSRVLLTGNLQITPMLLLPLQVGTQGVTSLNPNMLL